MELERVLSVSQLLDRVAAQNPGREAIYDLTRRLTYGELHKEVQQLASALVALGIEEGDRVGVSLPIWHEAVQLFFAIAKIGAILVPFNPKYRSQEVEYILANSCAKAVFVSEEFEKVKCDFASTSVQTVVTVRFEKEGCLSFRELIRQSDLVAIPAVPCNPADDIFCILYTSGTTGHPKGVMITHLSVVQSGMAIGASLNCTTNDVFIIVSPLFHVFGMSCNLMSAVYYQSKMVLVEKFKADQTLQLIQQEKVTVHHAVPSALAMELKQMDVEEYDLSSLRTGITGASPCPEETIKAVRERMGMNLCISFGSTETGSVTLTPYDAPEHLVAQTVGKAIDGVEIQIVNDQRETVLPGEVGEIACRGFGIMKGYYNLPEQTKQVLDSAGWFYTGDLGTMDEMGYIQFVGRKKEMIIRGGFNIYPQEIEGVLRKHPKVADVAVIGIPDPVMGESVYAAIQVKQGFGCTFEEIIEYLKPQFASFKLPSHVVFVDNLPVTASGKIQKTKLKEIIMETV
ncbi:class I adenylate-forming enzyme family protein [Brevibacillus nitrificans]|uniref:class I adenylate-forming enzyme family protein n=1 Tax=Brevibacillus nitrificans TaxID=651560 RepID=UPI002E1D03B8|nr:class I adenylate-forming enzyme family protein [Brevibacillus nitrificans]